MHRMDDGSLKDLITLRDLITWDLIYFNTSHISGPKITNTLYLASLRLVKLINIALKRTHPFIILIFPLQSVTLFD